MFNKLQNVMNDFNKLQINYFSGLLCQINCYALFLIKKIVCFLILKYLIILSSFIVCFNNQNENIYKQLFLTIDATKALRAGPKYELLLNTKHELNIIFG